MTRTTARLGGLAAALVAGTLVLAGCADENSAAAGRGSMASNGERASGASHSAAPTFNDADVAFVQGMLPHHQQAVEMAQLAEGRAADPRVLDLAARIEAAQAPEIDTLTGWLAEWDVDDAPAGIDHGGMGGMMSEQDMNALMSTSGAEFDRLFLEQMIAHHSGAVQMAQTEAGEGQNSDAIAMSGTIRDSQNAEIAEMEQLLTELGG